MWRILGTLALMVVCGVVAYVATLTSLMELGSKLHNNYEHYGGYPAGVLIYGCGIIGFLVPGVVVWYLHRRATRNGR